MSNTSFNPSELDPETEASAASRVAKILAGQQQHTEPKPQTEIHQAPAAHANPPAPTPVTPPASEPEQKRTRMTVGKLLQKYKDREAEAAAEMSQVEDQLNKLTAQREGLTAQRAFLQGLIAEIEAD